MLILVNTLKFSDGAARFAAASAKSESLNRVARTHLDGPAPEFGCGDIKWSSVVLFYYFGENSLGRWKRRE